MTQHPQLKVVPYRHHHPSITTKPAWDNRAQPKFCALYQWQGLIWFQLRFCNNKCSVPTCYVGGLNYLLTQWIKNRVGWRSLHDTANRDKENLITALTTIWMNVYPDHMCVHTVDVTTQLQMTAATNDYFQYWLLYRQFFFCLINCSIQVRNC